MGARRRGAVAGARRLAGTIAETLYREAIDRLEPTAPPVRPRPRSRLLYGEWLRRERRRLDAREQLRIAYELFADFGMEAFAERARIELRGDGRARPHTDRRHASISSLRRRRRSRASRPKGNTNREIAAQLFISPSTVEYHLRKAFRKLDVKSRTARGAVSS